MEYQIKSNKPIRGLPFTDQWQLYNVADFTFIQRIAILQDLMNYKIEVGQIIKHPLKQDNHLYLICEARLYCKFLLH